MHAGYGYIYLRVIASFYGFFSNYLGFGMGTVGYVNIFIYMFFWAFERTSAYVRILPDCFRVAFGHYISYVDPDLNCLTAATKYTLKLNIIHLIIDPNIYYIYHNQHIIIHQSHHHCPH